MADCNVSCSRERHQQRGVDGIVGQPLRHTRPAEAPELGVPEFSFLFFLLFFYTYEPRMMNLQASAAHHSSSGRRSRVNVKKSVRSHDLESRPVKLLRVCALNLRGIVLLSEKRKTDSVQIFSCCVPSKVGAVEFF